MKITKCKLKNDQQVLGILKKNTKGLSAYDVLRELQKFKNKGENRSNGNSTFLLFSRALRYAKANRINGVIN